MFGLELENFTLWLRALLSSGEVFGGVLGGLFSPGDGAFALCRRGSVFSRFSLLVDLDCVGGLEVCSWVWLMLTPTALAVGNSCLLEDVEGR